MQFLSGGVTGIKPFSLAFERTLIPLYALSINKYFCSFNFVILSSNSMLTGESFRSPPVSMKSTTARSDAVTI